MLSSTRQAIACILCIFTTAILAQSQTASVKELTSTVSGRVTVKDKPLQGVVVSLRLNDRYERRTFTSYKARTDVNGEYRITNVPAGNYLIVPLAPAFVTDDEPRFLIVNKAETIEHVDFALIRGAAITGKVIDADGRPVVEQDVQLFPVTNNVMGRIPPGGQAETDDRGVYRIYGLRPGSYKVGVGAGDDGAYGGYKAAFYKRIYHPSTGDITQATVIELSEGGEASNVDITVGRTMNTFTATGRIIDEAGQPVANVSYGVVQYITPNHTSSNSNGAVTNSRGEFKLDNLLPGKYAIFIRPGPTSNWNAEQTPFEIVDEDVTGLVVKTKKGATVSGVVVLEGADDKAAAELLRRSMLSAQVTAPNSERPSFGWTQIGADGSFTISGLAFGTANFNIPSSTRFRIVRVERGGVVQPRGVEIKEGEPVTGVRIVVNFGNVSLRGVIELIGGTLPPNANFYVYLRNTADDPMHGSPQVSADVDARGQFVVEGLLPGT
jgi:protocatechuate 3,4-dioxygenase beta subunit